MDCNQILKSYQTFTEHRKALHLYRDLQTHPPMLCFSNNDYLNLSQHPLVQKTSHDFIEKYGTGAKASRLLGDYNFLYQTLERDIATAKGHEKALVLASGFQANVSVLAALLDQTILGKTPLVFSDKLNHASIHFGCRAAGVMQHRYHHLDLNHLEALLIKHKAKDQPKFILTESVFGMDGDCADLENLVFLAKKYEAFLYVDEAHATGLYGPKGYGMTVPYGAQIDLIMGTFSKALGGFGAYIATTPILYHYLINRCAGFIYATALPPAVIGAAQAAWHLIPNLYQERRHLQMLAQNARDKLREDGYTIGQTSSHIIPIFLGSSEQTLSAYHALLRQGIRVSAIRPPTVPPNSARLRIALRADHKFEDVLQLQEALRCFLK